MKKNNLPEKPLTEVELELMNVIWRLSECTIKDVQTELAEERELAYTTVATVMKILEQKHMIISHKNDRVHTYQPLVAKKAYESLSLKHLAENLFQGSPSSMVLRLIGDEALDQEELEKIREALAHKIGQRK